MSKKITDESVIATVNAEISEADFQGQSTLSAQRAQADLAYTGQYTDGTAPTTGMSSVLINVLQPAVDTLTTYQSKLFCSDHETVVFAPKDPDDVEEAQKIMDKVNDVIHKENRGYEVINRWIKDSLLHKTGIVKVVKDETPVVHKEFFEGTPKEFKVYSLAHEEDGNEAIILEEEKWVDTRTFDVNLEDEPDLLEMSQETTQYKVKIVKPEAKVKIFNVPPEEFLINEGATSINDDSLTRFVAHRQIAYKGDVKAMFPDVDLDDLSMSSSSGLSTDYESQTRHQFDGTANLTSGSATSNALGQVEIVESWIKMSMEEDGDEIAWYHVFSSGNALLMKEEWIGPIPMCSFTPFPIPHKFYGMSLWDKLSDYQRTKTALVRSTVDYAVQQNTIRIIADPRKISTRDLKSGRPGIIKAKPGFNPNDVMPLNVGAGSPGATTTMLQYLDKEILAQIGIDPVTGMVSTDIEKSGNDAEKTSMTMDNSSTKIEMMAREFAETGLKDMIWAVTDCLLYMGEIEDVNLTKADLRAKVGLGFQTMKQKIQGAQAIMMRQEQLEMSPSNPTPIPAEQKLAISVELVKSMGYEEGDASKFFPKVEAVEAERARIAKQAEQAQAQQLEMQQVQIQAQNKLDETVMALNAAKAKEATVKADSAMRNQELTEELAVKNLDNIDEDNNLNARRQDAVEEQMIGKLELDKQKLALEVAKADDESENPTDVTHK